MMIFSVKYSFMNYILLLGWGVTQSLNSVCYTNWLAQPQAKQANNSNQTNLLDTYTTKCNPTNTIDDIIGDYG